MNTVERIELEKALRLIFFAEIRSEELIGNSEDRPNVSENSTKSARAVPVSPPP